MFSKGLCNNYSFSYSLLSKITFCSVLAFTVKLWDKSLVISYIKDSDSDKTWTKITINSYIPALQVYLSLLRMYLSPPDVHCLGPIKMELSGPQANLQAALQVLELHHSKLNTTKVNSSRAALHSSPG